MRQYINIVHCFIEEVIFLDIMYNYEMKIIYIEIIQVPDA